MLYILLKDNDQLLVVGCNQGEVAILRLICLKQTCTLILDVAC